MFGSFVYNAVTSKYLGPKGHFMHKKKQKTVQTTLLSFKAQLRFYQEPFDDFQQFHKIEDLISVDHSTINSFWLFIFKQMKRPRFCSTRKAVS